MLAPLRRLGFFFASLLPEFHRGDTLRLQRLPRGLREDEIPPLESDALRAVAEFTVREGRATQRDL